MRLFVAVNLRPTERESILAATARLRDAALPVRWLRPESIHLTLKFLGEVRREDVAEVMAAVGRVATKTQPFELPLRGVGAFPSIRRPRVIWFGAEATTALRCLKQDLEWALGALGFEREVRAFQPHLTLGRALPEARAGDFRTFEAIASGVDVGSSTHVTEIGLMRSHLSVSGSRYERIGSATLGVGNPVAGPASVDS